ncbi:MAG: hypothetical protein IKS09_00655 [Lachnospiraceae bacterium]|nr:hypothetical protein [Lachnospiraceae bacterium]
MKKSRILKKSVVYVLLAVFTVALFGRLSFTTASAKELSKKACAKKITTLTDQVATLKSQYKAAYKKDKGKAAKDGTAAKSTTIKEKYNKKNADLKEYKKAAKSVPVIEPELSLFVGDTLEKADYFTKIKNNSKYTTYTTTLSTEGIVSIGEDGTLTALAPGKTTLTVKCTQSGKKAKCVIVVMSEEDAEDYDESDEGEDELFESTYDENDGDLDEDDE